MAETEITRPIIGIENRMPQEVFDIMCDRIKASRAPDRDVLVEALRPFAAVAEKIARDHPGWDHDDFMLRVGSEPSRLGPYRRARAALSAIEARAITTEESRNAE